MPSSTRTAKFPDIKIVRPTRGGVYYYFNTGQKNPRGRAILKRLPDLKDPSFWDVVAALRGAKTKRGTNIGELSLARMIEFYRRSDHFRKLSVNTRDKYDIYLNKLGEAFDTFPAKGLERGDVVALIDSMGNRPGAANFQLKVISALYAWGRKRGHVTTRPCDDVEVPEMGEHEPWPAELLASALESNDAFIKLSVHLLYYTGQRIGDICDLRWSDLKDDRVRIVQEKTKAVVDFPIHPDLGAVLSATAKTGLMVLEHRGQPIQRQTVRYRIQKWAADQGCKIVPHGLRKNAVNALLEAGCSAAETAAITRQSLSLVEHYAKARDTAKLGTAAILKWGVRPKQEQENVRKTL